MSLTPRNLPRFLPTLTEVVPPSALDKRSTPPPSPSLEEVVQSVMQQVSLATERRFQDETDAMLRTLLAEHLPLLYARLRQELEIVVRQAVSQAMAARPDLHKIN